MSPTGSSDAIEAARYARDQAAPAERTGRREGHQRSARHPGAPEVTLAPVEAVPLDAEHERLALLYLAELLAPLFGSDGSA